MGGSVRRVTVAVFVVCAMVSGNPPASAATYAPLDQPGPALTPAKSAMDAALACTPSVTNAPTDPVLLSPGTATTAGESFGWNWEPALNQLGIPWCALDLPEQALGPIDVAGQYIVNAIREMHARSGRKVDIVGWSQGGMSMRWALRYWPDTRAMVDDVIGMEPSNHGTTILTSARCAQLGCRPSVFQQAADSEFIRALNSRAETFAGISYTNLYSHYDEIATPNSDAAHCTSCLSEGQGAIANIQLQQLCPLDLSDHVTGPAVSAANYHLVVDALTHDGPAVLARVPTSVCLEPMMPGIVDPASLAGGVAALEGAVGTLAILPGPAPNPGVAAPILTSEPTLPCYVYGTCGAGSGDGTAAGTTCAGLPATILGTRGADRIVGTPGRDVIVAGAGDDVISGRGGNDVICGGRGNDRLRGGRGKDVCRGGTGQDRARQCEVVKWVP